MPPEPRRVRPVGSVDALLCGGCRAADAASGTRAIGSAGERLVHTEEVTGSIPVSPTGLAWAGRWPSATSPQAAVSVRGAEPPEPPQFVVAVGGSASAGSYPSRVVMCRPPQLVHIPSKPPAPLTRQLRPPS
jgi:hypothetical protein